PPPYWQSPPAELWRRAQTVLSKTGAGAHGSWAPAQQMSGLLDLGPGQLRPDLRGEDSPPRVTTERAGSALGPCAPEVHPADNGPIARVALQLVKRIAERARVGLRLDHGPALRTDILNRRDH